MNQDNLKNIIYMGEDGTHQFKEMITNSESLAAEMVAFSNSQGGQLLIGVSDDGSISGLTPEQVRSINLLVSNVSSNNIQPPISPVTENVMLDEKIIVVINVVKGISKPYMDNKGNIWIKNGSDKRKASSREELQRLFQESGLIHADEVPVHDLGIKDLDLNYFREFYSNQYDMELDESEDSLIRLLQNMNLMRDGNFNLAGALLFCKSPHYKLPSFIVKAVSYPGNTVNENEYIDSVDYVGKLSYVYETSLSFLIRNIRNVQNGQGVNSLGVLEIPKIIFEELLTNALIHRDYFVSAPIRIFDFSDRIEIISPGHLPNNLTVENIKNGNSNIRNPILASFASKTMPYRGLGNGIRRSLAAYPHIEFIDQREENLFKVIIAKPNCTLK